MKKILALMVMLLSSYFVGYCQKLPSVFINELSDAITPTFTAHKDSVDMYIVAVVFSPEGKWEKISFSVGTPESVKEDFTRKLNAAYIRLTPMDVYWKKYCKENNIKGKTCFIQPIMVRFEDTDNKNFNVDQVLDKFSAAMTFEDALLGLKENMKLVWLPAKTSRLVHERVVE